MCSLICASLNLLVQHVLKLPAERETTPTEVGLEDLTDVHAARNAERVQHDVDRATVLRVRHVLFRHDAGDDALVAVASGHLVADLKLALDGDVDLHHLDHARRKLVALREAIDLVAEVIFADADDLLELGELRTRCPRRRPTGSSDQYLRGTSSRAASSMRLTLLEKDLALVVDELARRRLTDELLLEAAEERVAEDSSLPRRAGARGAPSRRPR